MESYALPVFILNFLLVLCDASLGYYVAPLVGCRGADDEEAAERTTRAMRRLLSGVVALYTLLNCFAYSRENLLLLLVVTGVILLDMLGQYLVRRKILHGHG